MCAFFVQGFFSVIFELKVLGLGLVLGCGWWLEEKTPFPSWRALVPCGGALILLAFSEKSVVNRYFLEHPLMVALGLLSYPW